MVVVLLSATAHATAVLCHPAVVILPEKTFSIESGSLVNTRFLGMIHSCPESYVPVRIVQQQYFTTEYKFLGPGADACRR